VDSKELRTLIRNGEFDTPTSGVAEDKVQANVVILPEEYAFEFLLFAMRNKKSVPIVEVLENGRYESKYAPDSDIRSDVPRYNIYKNGELTDTVTDISGYWEDDFVTFLIGCSFTFEQAILDEGIPIKHIDLGKNVAMYRTNIPNNESGIFKGEMVVSMRPFTHDKTDKVSEITSQYENMHGGPVHYGDPSEIGIQNIMDPDYGEAVNIEEGETPVFWGCGVTPQNVALQAEPSIMITHSPGHMFVTDINNQSYLEKNG